VLSASGVVQSYALREASAQSVLPIVGFEIKPMPGEDPDIVIAGTKRVWKEAWARLH
jgi:hypothetical protein